MAADMRADGGLMACDLCIIGAGSGGLVLAAGAAQMGARVVLIEHAAMGGECLNTGCVPSKAILAAAHAAHAAANAGRFGIELGPQAADFGRVHDHIHGVIASIAPHDSVERFEGLGVQVLKGWGRFTGPAEVAAGAVRVKARRYVIATGSHPVVPPVKGLAASRPLTNETIFGLTGRPDRLIVLGGGPAGLEMAQAFARLGSAVTVIERFGILAREDPDAAEAARAALRADGVDIIENAEVTEVSGETGGVEAVIAAGGQPRRIIGTHLFVAAGRAPNTEGLGLDVAGIDVRPGGIAVDAGLRTSNRRVYAIGDVTGGPQFTHAASYQAGLVMRSALLGLPAKAGYSAFPRVTYLDPEIAHVGLTEAEARKSHGGVTVLRDTFTHNDRALTERRTEGFVKLVLGRRGHILGATIVAPHAGEMIGMWGLAISRKLPVSAIAGMIAPYPTLSELPKRAAGSYYAPTLFGPKVRKLVRLVQDWLP